MAGEQGGLVGGEVAAGHEDDALLGARVGATGNNYSQEPTLSSDGTKLAFVSYASNLAPYDTNFPCSDRSCVPQPAPLGAVDILSYRQRPTFRAAYRNFGSYQSIVATQSVEGAPNMAGMRWWEIRAPGASAELYQDSTYVPMARRTRCAAWTSVGATFRKPR